MSDQPITAALGRAARGDPGAAAELWELVYQDLKRLANARLGKLAPGQTMQATALVHEVWMRLDASSGFDGRAHFFGAAANAMRNILVDQARRKGRLRRNSGQQAATLTSDLAVDDSGSPIDLLALDEALTAFAKEYERPAKVVVLRFFAGLSIAEIAELLGVTTRTIDREFLFARTWLRRCLSQSE